MKLNLKRPLAFFDLEATGVNVGADRIVEIAILKINIDGSQELKTCRVNPEIKIPLEASLIHGIYDEDVKDLPTFKEIALDIQDFLGDSDLAGYNSNKFDIPLLLEEFLRSGIDFNMSDRKTVDVQNIFHQMEQRTLKAAYKFYCHQELENAHQAEADIKATYEVLLAQLEKYKDVEFESKDGVKSVPVQNDIDALHNFTNLNKVVDFAGRMVYNEEGKEVINFGKHKGKVVEDVFSMEPSYYSWMKQGDFPLYTKKKLDEIWKRWNANKDTSKVIPTKPERTDKPKFQKNFKPSSKPKVPAKPVSEDMLEQLKLKFGK
ncbi:MAG: 3'-5' exonuclease [Pedobacter sp.]|nr:MAG: 3'-5' exonuclease [Pedobacter sp.]